MDESPRFVGGFMSPRPLQTNWPNTSSPADLSEMKKRGWIEKGILAIDRNAPGLSWEQIFMIDTLGNSLYGERKP